MLNHGHIALVALLLKIGFVFFYVAELYLLVFFLRRENRRAGESRVKR